MDFVKSFLLKCLYRNFEFFTNCKFYPVFGGPNYNYFFAYKVGFFVYKFFVKALSV